MAVARRRIRPTSLRPQPVATLLAIYRAENAATLETLLGQGGGLPLDVRLWALDRCAPTLEAHTVGCGPSGKFDLLNRLMESRPMPSAHPMVIVDDDVILRRGTLARLLDVIEKAHLDVAQPAHEPYSFHTYPVTRRRRLCRAQLSTFVEIGPLLVIGPAWRDHIVPFPSGIGMGWGLELAWRELHDEGCRFGIVDVVTLVHTRPIGHAYDTHAEMEHLADRLRRYGISGGDTDPELRGLLNRGAAWRLWQRRAPWLPVQGRR